MKRIFALITLTIALSVISCAKKEIAQVRGPVVLKLGYEKGKHYLYETSMRVQSTVDMGGMSHTANVLNDIKYEIVPENIKGDTLDLRVTIKDVNISLRTAAGSQNLPEANILKDKSIKFRVLKNGNVIHKDSLVIDDENLKSILENMSELFTFVPDVPVKLKDTWKDSTKESVNVFALSDISVKDADTVATITLKSTFDRNTTSKRKGMEVKTEIKGTGEGKIRFSINRGIILSTEMNAGLEGTTHMKGGMAGEGMDMPMYIDQTVESKLIKEY